MLGLYSEFSITFLWLLGSITTITFALPLFFVPLTWAKLMMWKLPNETDLAVYFGRCVGAFVLIIEFFIFKAALTGEGVSYTFDLLAAVFILMLIVHIYGALRKIQPITETLEIGLWAFLLLVTYLCYPLA